MRHRRLKGYRVDIYVCQLPLGDFRDDVNYFAMIFKPYPVSDSDQLAEPFLKVQPLLKEQPSFKSSAKNTNSSFLFKVEHELICFTIYDKWERRIDF